MKYFKLILSLQTIYYLIAAVWPLLDIESFMLISGPGMDIWTVEMVAFLLLSVSISFLSELVGDSKNPLAVALLGMSCTAGLIIIDIYSASGNILSLVYFADGLVETCLLAGWIALLLLRKQELTYNTAIGIEEIDPA